jgi:hypothetical protein
MLAAIRYRHYLDSSTAREVQSDALIGYLLILISNAITWPYGLRERIVLARSHMQNKGFPQDFIDPKGYWIDNGRNIRRMSSAGLDEQPIIMRATQNCSDAEWSRLYEAIARCLKDMGPVEAY